MDYAEGLILGFIIILSLIALLYVGYFHYSRIKKMKEQMADEAFSVANYFENKKDHKTRNIILNVCAYSFLVVALLCFTGSIILSAKDDIFTINNQYIVQIDSKSMASNEITNTYLKDNNVKNKLYEHDLIAFDKTDENSEFKLMDILLYHGKVNGKDALIAHRLLKINEDGTLILRGDANKENDPNLIKKDDVIGIYSHRLEFLSLTNYVAHSPSFYVAFSVILLITFSFDLTNFYIEKEIRKYKVSQ